VQHHKSKKTLGSYPYLTVVFSITMALFVIGLFGLVILHASRLSEVIKGNIEMQVYLQRTLSDEEKQSLKQTLEGKQYVSNNKGVAQVSFIPKEAAAKKFIDETGEDFIKFLGQNPLRDAYIIKVSPRYSESAKMKVIKKDLEKIPGVFEVEYVESLVNAINNNLSKIGIILITFAVFLLLTVTVLINSTIKLALFSQRFLIRSMQLVGAKASFIIKPFIGRAALQGLLAGLLAVLMLAAVMQYGYTHIPELELLYQPEPILILFATLLLAGSFIGLISALLSVNRYLKMSLDDLY
jgi:cell division transport system permease protein